MADFQFYRPQVNALERLWSQYAESMGATGGAFARGLAPGLETGLTNIGKGLAAKAEREFQETLTDKKLTNETNIASDRLKAEADRAAAERADKVIGSQVLLQNSGLFPDWQQRGEVIADPQIANQMIADREQQLAKEEEDAALAAKEAKAQDARRSANSLLTRLLVNDAMTPNEARAIGERLRVADEKGVVEIVGELGSRGMELDARRAAIGDYKRFTSELKELGKTGTIPQARDQDAFDKAQYEAEAAYDKLRSPKYMAPLTPEQRASVKDDLQRSVNDMRRLMGRSGMQDPSFRAQIAKDYPGLEEFQGRNIAYNNGRISGTAQETANFQRMVNDRLKDDQEFRTQLRSVGVADGFDLNLYMSNPTAAMGETATPDKKAQIDQIVKAAKDRVGQQVLGELGASVNRVPVPNGYIDVGSMDEAQRTKFGADLRAAAMAFMAMKGRGPTKTEGQQMMADMGYWDINAPTLRKAEPKPKEAPKAKETPKAKEAPKETPKTAQAQETAKPKETSKPPTPEQLLVRQAGQGQRPASIIGYGRPAAPSPKVEIDTTSPSGVALRIREILRESDQLGPAYRAIEGGAVGALNVLGNMASVVGRGTFFPPGAAEKQTGYRQYIGRQLSANQILPGVPNSEAEALVRRAIQQQASLPYNPVPGFESAGYMNYPVYQVRPPRR